MVELTPEPDERSAATGTAQVATSARTAELAAGWEAAQREVAAAAWAAGRQPDEVRIVVVTKTWPVSDVAALATLGVTEVGENRLPELRDKRAELAAAATLRWHFLGQLQTNKAKQVAALADQIDTVDRPRLVDVLGKAIADSPRTLDVLLQVNLDPSAQDQHRGGCAPDAARAVADRISATDGLRLRGVMGMAPLGGDATQAFALLAQVAQGVAADHPGATEISAGMSGDFAAAIAAGATHVRLGTAILGVRGKVG